MKSALFHGILLVFTATYSVGVLATEGAKKQVKTIARTPTMQAFPEAQVRAAIQRTLKAHVAKDPEGLGDEQIRGLGESFLAMYKGVFLAKDRASAMKKASQDFGRMFGALWSHVDDAVQDILHMAPSVE